MLNGLALAAGYPDLQPMFLPSPKARSTRRNSPLGNAATTCLKAACARPSVANAG
jgi:hypothetical protein